MFLFFFLNKNGNFVYHFPDLIFKFTPNIKLIPEMSSVSHIIWQINFNDKLFLGFITTMVSKMAKCNNFRFKGNNTEVSQLITKTYFILLPNQLLHLCVCQKNYIIILKYSQQCHFFALTNDKFRKVWLASNN